MIQKTLPVGEGRGKGYDEGRKMREGERGSERKKEKEKGRK